MALTQREISEALVEGLRFLSDAELEDILALLPNPSQTEIVNIAIRATWLDSSGEQPEEFKCGDTDRPQRPPNA